MNKRITFKLLIVFILSFFMILGSDSRKKENTNIKIPKDNIIVEVNLANLNIKTDELKVSNGIISKELDNNQLDLNISKEEKTVVGVFKNGQPILLGRKIAGESSVDISLESSAEIFVLYHPRFNGVKSNNPKELSMRIRKHPEFKTLVKTLEKEIKNNNPCPMDPICSPKVRNIAIKIAEDLRIDDLYNKDR